MLDSERKGIQQDFVRELQNLLEQFAFGAANATILNLHKLSPAEVCGLLEFQIHIIAIEIDRMASAKEERVSNGAQQPQERHLSTDMQP